LWGGEVMMTSRGEGTIALNKEGKIQRRLGGEVFQYEGREGEKQKRLPLGGREGGALPGPRSLAGKTCSL